jgi:hypothetical protein
MEGARDFPIETQHAHCYTAEYEQPEAVVWPTRESFEALGTETDFDSEMARRRPPLRFLPNTAAPPRYGRFVLAIMKMPVVREERAVCCSTAGGPGDEDERDKPSSEKKEKPDMDPSPNSEEPRMPGTSPDEVPKGNPDTEADRKGEKVNFETRGVGDIILAKL